MSYDLAVWEGERPESSQEAVETHLTLYAQYVEDDRHTPPILLIVKFVEVLLQRCPEVSEDENSPWSTAPLISEARGPYLYFYMGWRQAHEVSAFPVGTGASVGMVCCDPQKDQLRP